MTSPRDLQQYSSLERMRSGQWHLPGFPAVEVPHQETFAVVKRINDLGNTDQEKAAELWREMLSADSEVPYCHAPVYVEFGQHLSFGDSCFLNFHTTILNTAPVTFGEHVQVGPNCQFITVTHPVEDARMRRGGWERAEPITVGSDVWFGAGVTVLPGVTIGDGAVVAAGSLVTKDVPPASLAMGHPATVIRTLGEDASRLERTELDEQAPVDGLERLEPGALTAFWKEG